MRLPTVWRLPGGYRIRFEYVDSLGGHLGEWHGFTDQVGLIRVEKGPLDEMADTVFHEMIHAMIDWHAAHLRPMQRGFLAALLKEAARQAAEQVE